MEGNGVVKRYVWD